jgi:hypothetical protein
LIPIIQQRQECPLNLITQAVQEGNRGLMEKLDKQSFEVEQWQVGLFALDSPGYEALKEIVATGNREALHWAA